MRKLLSNTRCIPLFGLLLISACAVLLAQVFDTAPLAQVFDWDGYLAHKSFQVNTLGELAADFQSQQTVWMPVAPPSTNAWGWSQESDPTPLLFDPARFPRDFLANLVPAQRDGVVVYPLTVVEDPITRERGFYNADGQLIGVVAPAADYDPRWALNALYPDLAARGWPQSYVEWLSRVYDSSHLAIRYELILDADLAQLILRRSVVEALQADGATLSVGGGKGGGAGRVMLRSAAAETSIVFDAISRTNGIKLQIGYPDAFTNRLEIFTCTNLIDFWWTPIATNLSTLGTNTIYWTDADATNWTIRFYVVGNADLDADTDEDGDGLTYAREKYLYHTSMSDRDSDGDGLVDGYSGVVSTNAYPGGAHTNGGVYVEGEMTWATEALVADTDGDGMSDGWEVANGHDPLDPNDPPNVSGTVTYEGRQTGTVWVVAVTESNSWATNYSTTLAGPGTYRIPNMAGTSYWLKAWVDTTADGVTNATEAWGVSTNSPVLVTNQVTGEDITLTDADEDSDGVPDWWEVQYFGSITNWTGSGDPDSDEYTNQEEYEADTDPTNALSHPRNISGTITYTGPQTGAIYVVACTSSIGWVAARYTTNAAPGSYTITHLPPNADYWVKAWSDSTGDGSNTLWEAWGEYSGNPVCLGPNAIGVDITLADPDSDGDGLPDWWEVQYELDPWNGSGDDAAAWWKFDEGIGTNVQDSTAHTNTGVLCNVDSNAWTGGIMSNAVCFNGTNGYAQFEDSASLKPNYVSVSLWVKPTQDYTNGSAVFFSKKQPDGATGYRVSYEQGALSFLVCASGSKSVSLPYGLTNSVWHHMVGTYGGANHRFYMDGVLRGSTNYDWGQNFGYVDQGTTAPRIAASTDSTPSNYFAGVIDDVRVYNRELASNEVHAIYELGADLDGDGLSNFDEYHYGACAVTPDTDQDGLSDGQEVQTYHTNPVNSDTDGDGIPDGEEVAGGTNPNSADSDSDGLTDYTEIYTYFGHVDPTDADSDNDGLNDYAELVTHGTYAGPECSGAQDSDGDGLSDYAEAVTYGTDPRCVDSDGDGIDDGYEVGKGWNPLDAATATQNPDGDAFNNLTEYQWDYQPTISNSTPPTSQELILCPHGSNAVQHSDWNMLALGNMGAFSARIRVRPFCQSGALAEQRLYHTQSPGFYINGTAASSLASPITVPASSTAIEYTITSDAAARGTNLYFRLTTTNEPTATKDSARCYFPEIEEVNFWGPGSANYVDVSYGQTNTLWIGMPANTNDCRVRMQPTQGPTHWYGIGYYHWTDWVLVKVTGSGADPANATLNALDWQSAYGVWNNDITTRGIRLDPGSYTFEVGYDMNGNGTLESSEVQETCQIEVVNARITEPDGLAVQAVSPGDSHFRFNPSCFEWQYVHESNLRIPYSQSIQGEVAPIPPASYSWTVSAGKLTGTNTATPTYQATNMTIPSTMTAVTLDLRPLPGNNLGKQTRTLEVYRDHLQRDYENWGTGIACGAGSDYAYRWNFSRYAMNWQMPHGWNCFGSVWHAYDGTQDGSAVNIPSSSFTVTTNDDPIS